MKIRALIVDDEKPARDLVATLASAEPDIEIVGEAASGPSAVAALDRFSPDLLFLDIQLPGFDGFEVLKHIPTERWPLVIFITAHDQHAIRAFELHAMDYLLKPFEYDRLRQAISRARGHLQNHTAAAQQSRLLAALEKWQNQSQSQSSELDRIVVRQTGRVTFVKTREIDWIEAEGNYLRLHCGQERFVVRETMSSIETRLARKNFLRVNRSALVNLERVREWQPLFHGDSILILQNGCRVPVTRVYRANLDRAVTHLEKAG